MKINLNQNQIIELLQISPPFLMISQAYDVQPGISSSSFLNLNSHDWFFDCHLKKHQAMPGTLQIEAMLQTFVLSIYTQEENRNKIAFVIDIKTKLFKKVSPNSKLIINTKIISNKRGIYKGIGTCLIDEKIVCQGEFLLGIPSIHPIS